ncbi:hypothetical protein BGX34_004352 [Mortierella sp. NVP85]|nr:hypothetical protein BGX34_004352 [Mortierella sp. NVP85]
MSGPPVFVGKLDTSLLSDLQIHEYFRIYKPDEWDPVHFAQYSEAATLDDFKQDLRAIASRRICSSIYASEWLKYLKTPSGNLFCSKAQEVFAIKKSAVKNQTKFTSLQAKFSTGDNVKRKQTAKRIAGEEAVPDPLRNPPQVPGTPPSPTARTVEMINDRRKRQRPSEILPPLPSSNSFYVDPDGFPTMVYILGGDDVGAAFHEIQQYGAFLANDPSERVTMLSVNALNYIWDTSFDLGLKQRTSQLIRDQFSRPKFNFTRDHVLLMHDLEQELEEGDIQRTAASHDQLGNELVDIYRALKRDLPVTSFPFDEIDGEDTFVHKTLHSIFSTVFEGFHIRWANKAARGSRERRKGDKKEGLRPDYQVLKNDVPLLYLEVKPLSSMTEQEYLSDRWKLANMAKDELDASYHKHIRLPFMTVIQIFGRKMEVHTITLQHGIYHMSQQFRVHVPCGRDDGAAIQPCLRALYSIKAWLDEVVLPPTYELFLNGSQVKQRWNVHRRITEPKDLQKATAASQSHLCGTTSGIFEIGPIRPT